MHPELKTKPPAGSALSKRASQSDSVSRSLAGVTASRSVAESRQPGRLQGNGFLFSPAIDLLFIANVFWPLLLLVDASGSVQTHESLLFWQIYFITAPHRWITLVLVLFDSEKTQSRRGKFFGFGISILAVTLCLRFGTGSLLCLGMIDYVWNAWHFSSQHHGIFRIYERKGISTSSGWGLFCEKLIFRAFLLYVIARVAGLGWQEGPFAGSEIIAPIDWVWLVVPAWFVARQWIRCLRNPTGSLSSAVYLTSVMTLFASMLMASHLEKGQLVLQLALASAVFHSLEYLSIVTWSVQQSQARNQRASRATIFSYLSQMWILFLIMFVVVIGAGNYFLQRGFFETWVLVNIVVAFWHYCFDGMIWKSSRRAAVTTTSLKTATGVSS